jgi:hypothetical protein
MEVMTQQPGTDTWIPWPNVPRGLLAALKSPAACVLLYSADPEAELSELTSSVRLIRGSGGRGTHVVVASTRGTGRWLDEVRMAGVDRIWLLDEPHGRLPGRLLLDPVREVPGPRPVAERGAC